MLNLRAEDSFGDRGKMKRKTAIVGLLLLVGLLVWTAGLVLAAWPVVLGPAPQFAPQTQGLEPAGLHPVAYIPMAHGVLDEQPETWVDTQDREAVRAYYLTEYLASDDVSSGWTGDHASCNAGTTSAEFKEAIMRRINYFRAMGGVPPITGLKDEYNNKAQQAALILSVNGALSHDPPPEWLCYTVEGDEGAGNSNIYLGVYGPEAMSGYMYDAGDKNYAAGHRRWILYPQTQWMGTGDIPPTSYAPSNALWVFDDENIWGDRPGTREHYVAWPPPGYAPYQVVYPRWSFAYAGANFDSATVSMTRNGQPLPVQVNQVEYGYGENTIVWEPADSFGFPPDGDIVYQVTVSNVLISNQPQEFTYQVTVFEP